MLGRDARPAIARADRPRENLDGGARHLADRLADLGDTLRDDVPLRLPVAADPFLDDRLRVANLPDEPQTVTVTNPISGATKDVQVALFRRAGP